MMYRVIRECDPPGKGRACAGASTSILYWGDSYGAALAVYAASELGDVVGQSQCIITTFEQGLARPGGHELETKWSLVGPPLETETK